MSLFSTVELSRASSGVVRDDNQKTDHDGGLEAASVGGLFHYRPFPSSSLGDIQTAIPMIVKARPVGVENFGVAPFSIH
jgi:hypothetical protein